MTHAGWHSRGYLPHLDGASLVQHVVFRLAGSLPAAALAELKAAPKAARVDIVERFLDSGLGQRSLGEPAIASAVARALLRFDGDRYDLRAWCVMPNHVHVLLLQREGFALGAVVHSWKSFTANQANTLLGQTGRFWAAEYFDRSMRDEEQTARVAEYIEYNPVAAGLCGSPGDWPWSSAHTAKRQEERAGSPRS